MKFQLNMDDYAIAATRVRLTRSFGRANNMIARLQLEMLDGDLTTTARATKREVCQAWIIHRRKVEKDRDEFEQAVADREVRRREGAGA